MPHYTRKEDIDGAVRNREFETLANYVKDGNIRQQSVHGRRAIGPTDYASKR